MKYLGVIGGSDHEYTDYEFDDGNLCHSLRITHCSDTGEWYGTLMSSETPEDGFEKEEIFPEGLLDTLRAMIPEADLPPPPVVIDPEVFGVEDVGNNEFQSIFPTEFAGESAIHSSPADAWQHIAQTLLMLAQQGKNLDGYDISYCITGF
jgi:hypothetical protein